MVDVEERLVRLGSLLVEQPRQRSGQMRPGRRRRVIGVDVDGQVADDRHSHRRMSLETERQNGDEDEEDGYDRRHLQHAAQQHQHQRHRDGFWRLSVRPSVCPAGILIATHQGQHATRPAYISARQ